MFAVALGAFVLMGVAIQLAHGAYETAFNGHADEASQLVTSLLYRDYLLNGTGSPFEFAKWYYAHYPFLAAGHWPPGFHLVAALWTVLFGVGRAPFFALLAVTAGLTAVLLFRQLRSEAGLTAAGVFCGLWLLLGQSQAAMTRVMAEGQCALLTFAAVSSYAAYLRRPGYARAFLFGALASGAVMTKYTAISLAVVPPLCLLLTRRWGLLRCGHFWLPAAMTGASLGAWLGWVDRLGVGRYQEATLVRAFEVSHKTGALARLLEFPQLVGWPLLLLSLLGMAATLSRRPANEHYFTWAVNGSLLFGGLLFHLTVAESEEVRHLYHLTPSLFLFAGLAVSRVTQRFSGVLRSPAAALLALSCAVLAAPAFTLPHKKAPEPDAIVRIAEGLTADDRAETVLVSGSQGSGEGLFVAEVALREPHPHRYLIRASKTIYRVSWAGSRYRQLIVGKRRLKHFLEGSAFDAVALLQDPAVPLRPDQRELLLVLSAQHGPWRADSTTSSDDNVALYRRDRPAVPTKPIRLRTSNRLGVDLEIQPHVP